MFLRSLFFQVNKTSAPDLVFEFLQITFAPFLSSKVLPIKIPRPSPDFGLSSLDEDLI